MMKFSPISYNKFRNKKVIVDGITFDSKKEAGIYQELKAMKDKGEITDLRLQVTYELVPAQKEKEVKPNKKGKLVEKEKVVERAVTYTADFVVTHPDGEVVVIDAKGSRGLDQKYPIKRKLMRHVHGIKIEEV